MVLRFARFSLRTRNSNRLDPSKCFMSKRREEKTKMRKLRKTDQRSDANVNADPDTSVGAEDETSNPNAPTTDQSGPHETTSLADDLLVGAEAISIHMFGNEDKARHIYHLNEKNYIPSFKMGNLVCLRKSTLEKWMRMQENITINNRKIR